MLILVFVIIAQLVILFLGLLAFCSGNEPSDGAMHTFPFIVSSILLWMTYIQFLSLNRPH